MSCTRQVRLSSAITRGAYTYLVVYARRNLVLNTCSDYFIHAGTEGGAKVILHGLQLLRPDFLHMLVLLLRPLIEFDLDALDL